MEKVDLGTDGVMRRCRNHSFGRGQTNDFGFRSFILEAVMSTALVLEKAARLSSTGVVRLSGDDRVVIIDLLERALVSGATLAVLMCESARLLPEFAEADLPLPQDVEAAILQRNWSSVSSKTLAFLVLGPTVLQGLSDRIWKELPLEWMPVFRRLDDLEAESLGERNASKLEADGK